MKCLTETIVFLIVFILLRSFSGGYHAKAYSFCSFVTFSIYTLIMLFCRYLPINYIAFLILFLLGNILLFAFSPIKNPNKEISYEKSIQHKITSLLLFSTFCIIGITLIEIYAALSYTIFYTLCADILLLFPKNKKGKEAC